MLGQSFWFGLIGGLGLFIYGIYLMGEGLEKAAGDKLRNILKALTTNTLMGTLVGTLITSIIQSSSATTVMVVGFVNAGLMTLKQSLGVIFGANIGTTVTAQIIAFKVTHYALPFAGVGAALYLFSHKSFWKYLGLFILGFGILFIGLNFMTEVVKPISESQEVKDLFLKVNSNTILAVIVGAIVTGIIQSSSVTTGIILALASVGLLDIHGAIPLIFGANIGTCVTALIASVGTNVSARRAAVAHIGFNIIGSVYFLLLIKPFTGFVETTSLDLTRQCANAHTIFNVINTLVFLPFTGLYAKLIERIVPGKDVVGDMEPKFLEKHLLNTPIIAIEAATSELIRMTDFSQDMVNDAMKGFLENNEKFFKDLPKKEAALDRFQEAVTDYLMQLTQKELTAEEARKIPALLHSVNDIERIGDHSENLIELALRKIESKLPFSEHALDELKEMQQELTLMFEGISKALKTNSKEEAQVVLHREEKINQLTERLRQNHIDRLTKGDCKVLSGIVFLDMVSNFEKIGDHITNVAQAVLDRLQWKT